MDWYVILTFTLAAASALVSFFLSLIEQKDKRKKFLGYSAKELKKYSAYISLALLILSLVNQTNHDFRKKFEEIEKGRKADSIQRVTDSTQRVHFDYTLKAIDKTLKVQNNTLDSTKSILDSQRIELLNQVNMLHKQEQTIYGNTKIITGQAKELNDIADVIYNTDPVYNSIIKISWEKKFDSVFVNTLKESLSRSDTSLKEYERDKYIIEYPLLKRFNGFYDLVIYFMDEKADTNQIENLFLLDLKRIDPSFFKIPSYPSISSFTNLHPKISIETSNYIRPESFIHCENSDTKEIFGFYQTETLVRFAEGYKCPFSNLSRMPCIIFIKNLSSNVKVYPVDILNADGHKKITIEPEKEIFTDMHKTYVAGDVYSYIYLGRVMKVAY